MFLGLPGLALALGVGSVAHAQEDPARPLGRCGDVMPRTATPARAAIVFDYASDRLDPIAHPAIDSMIEQGVAGAHLCVEVHTSTRGDAAQNLTLSRARAWAVLTALRQGGVAETSCASAGTRRSARVGPGSWGNCTLYCLPPNSYKTL